MKNYKHASKNVNGMKLAAVASAAVMLAPVAMNSVSSFATGNTTTTIDSKNYNTYYPVYKVVSLTDGAAAGTNGQISSPLVGYNANTANSAVSKVLSISTTKDAANAYTDEYNDLVNGALDAQNAALKLQAGLDYTNTSTGTDTYFAQLSGANQKANIYNVNKLNTKLNNIMGDVSSADATLKQAATDADNAYKMVQQDPANATAAAGYYRAYNTAKAAYTKAVQGYNDYVSGVQTFDDSIARQTNNGAVTEAANEAALAISKMTDGAAKDADINNFQGAQGEYLLATQQLDASIPGNAAKLDAAANKAVAELKKIANDSYAGDTTKYMGTVHVNYNKNYGIQIWTKDGQRVSYNSVDAAAAGKKVGDAKKLAGQSNWKVFNDKYTANGTTYYNLGGDQYIDAAYVTFTPATK